MHFAYWMVLIAALLPYLTVGGAKSRGIDNARPRESMAKLQGWRLRADWAHRNHFEAFPAFAAGVIIAELKHAPQSRIDWLAGAFVVFRLAYGFAYIGNQPSLRSAVWAGGMVCVVALFVTG